jgi:hypothetical protein
VQGQGPRRPSVIIEPGPINGDKAIAPSHWLLKPCPMAPEPCPTRMRVRSRATGSAGPARK